MPFAIPTEQKDLKRFIERRHPEYYSLLPHWEFLEATYKGGRAWFKDNIFRYLKEGTREFNDRLNRAYRFNHTREVVDLVTKYVFKGEVIRNVDDASDSVQRFWKRSTQDGKTIDQFMQSVCDKTSELGRVWVVVDSTRPGEEEEVLTVEDQKRADIRPYAYILTPQNVLDFSYGPDGTLNWLLAHETARQDDDPFFSSGSVNSRFRLWSRDAWYLFELQEQNDKRKAPVVSLIDHGIVPIGIVPVFPVDHKLSSDPYSSEALINEIAYLDRAAANYLSNMDAIIQDQTFSQLAMPAQNVLPGQEGFDALLEMGTKRVFLYDGEGGVGPKYISPDAAQAELIISVINKIISEIYHSVGMAGERTKQDNSQGIDNSSGVAKAFDFERMNSLLSAKASSLDTAENRLIRMVKLWAGEIGLDDEPDQEDLVKYPESFDVRGLYDEFDVATRLALIDAPESVRREQMKDVVEKLFPRLAKNLKAKMLEELEEWPTEETDVLQAGVRPEERPLAGGIKKNRQGENGGDDENE